MIISYGGGVDGCRPRRTCGEKCANKINPKSGKACARARGRCTNVATTDRTDRATTVTATAMTTATVASARRTRNSVRKLRVRRRRRSRDQCCCSRVRRAVVRDSTAFFVTANFFSISVLLLLVLPPPSAVSPCVPQQTRTPTRPVFVRSLPIGRRPSSPARTNTAQRPQYNTPGVR